MGVCELLEYESVLAGHTEVTREQDSTWGQRTT